MTEEINYILNLQLGDNLTYSDLRKIEISIVKAGNELKRIFGDSDASKIIDQIIHIINLARTAQVTMNAIGLALIPGAGIVQGIYAATTAVGFGFSVYDSIQGL